jgi:DNA polymerase III sliding clamp (beta) subunit (PCNA family)
MTICEVRVSPNNSIRPNIGSIELSEALSRVLPFVSREDNRPVLQCVLFTAKEGKLTMVSADGFRLSVVSLDYDDGEGQALIHLDDLKGIANALKSAKRTRISFEGEDVSKTSSLIIDTELIRYKWLSYGGDYPQYEKLIPSEFNTIAHLDTIEAVKAISSLKALAGGSKSYPVDLSLNGGIVMSNPDDKGKVSMPADIEGGEVKVRIDGSYLSEALKACGGMVDFKLTDSKSPVLFTVDGYKLVVMPMTTSESQKPKDKGEVDNKAKETKPQAKANEAKEPVKPKANKPKPKAKEPVAAK